MSTTRTTVLCPVCKIADVELYLETTRVGRMPPSTRVSVADWDGTCECAEFVGKHRYGDALEGEL